MEPNDAATSSARAQELRASLGARREVEALLAEASATREAAVADADALIEEAQQVSEQLLRESRAEAERVTTDARQRAEGLVGRARSEAEDITREARAAADAVRARAEAQVEEHRRRVRAELTEQVTREVHEQSRRELARVQGQQQAMIGDLEASVRILGVSMEAAVANVAEMLASLDSLRTHTVESLGDTAEPFTAPPRHAEPEAPEQQESSTEPERETPAERRPEPLDDLFRPTTTPVGDAAADEVPGAGTLFRNSAPTGSVPAPQPVFADAPAGGPDDTSDRTTSDEGEDDERPPLTATEAFLRSSHLDHGDPPLPPLDDTEVGNRYARDAQQGAERTGGSTRADAAEGERRERSAEGAEVPGKPLGWLFRSSS